MARITILGGTGYAGAAIVAEAANRGHEVTSVSRSDSASATANRFAARIGPTVCELDGPIPMLNRSKTLTVTGPVCSRTDSVEILGHQTPRKVPHCPA